LQLKQEGFENALMSHCLSTNDSCTFLIACTSQSLMQAPSPTLSDLLYAVVSKQLELLANDGGLIEKEHVELNLGIFLFSLPVSTWTNYLRTLPWSNDVRTQLDLVICRALIKPAIYLHLSSIDYRLALNALHDKKASYQNIFILLAEQAELTRLDVPILKVLTNQLPFQVLLRCQQNRRHPTLVILALEKGLEEHQDQIIISGLIQALHHELGLFASKPSPP
jgi:hypothetical protein